MRPNGMRVADIQHPYFFICSEKTIPGSHSQSSHLYFTHSPTSQPQGNFTGGVKSGQLALGRVEGSRDHETVLTRPYQSKSPYQRDPSMHSLRSFSRDDMDAGIARAGIAYPGGCKALSYPPGHNLNIDLRRKTDRDSTGNRIRRT